MKNLISPRQPDNPKPTSHETGSLRREHDARTLAPKLDPLEADRIHIMRIQHAVTVGADVPRTHHGQQDHEKSKL